MSTNNVGHHEPPMTVKELSEYLRLDRMTIYKMLKEHTIPASRIGHQWRFFRDDIDAWIRSHSIQDAPCIIYPKEINLCTTHEQEFDLCQSAALAAEIERAEPAPA